MIRLDRVKPVEEKPTTQRRCLGCERWFSSTGPGHRICDLCKKGMVWASGQDVLYSRGKRGTMNAER